VVGVERGGFGKGLKTMPILTSITEDAVHDACRKEEIVGVDERWIDYGYWNEEGLSSRASVAAKICIIASLIRR
jgi:hypothetical protein